jgi:hypothetical protein
MSSVSADLDKGEVLPELEMHDGALFRGKFPEGLGKRGPEGGFIGIRRRGENLSGSTAMRSSARSPARQRRKRSMAR